MRPIEPFPWLTNHRAPSGPDVMLYGSLMPKPLYLVTAPPPDGAALPAVRARVRTETPTTIVVDLTSLRTGPRDLADTPPMVIVRSSWHDASAERQGTPGVSYPAREVRSSGHVAGGIDAFCAARAAVSRSGRSKGPARRHG